jgi:Ras-related protein Rab-6A
MAQVTKKVVIIGDTGVGKTALMNRFLFDKFDPESMPTLGAQSKPRIVEVPGEGQIKLTLWDTAGQEKFKSLTRMYFQDAEAALIVYDTTFQESFESAAKWVEDLKANANVPDILIALVGNKSDMAEDMKVTMEDA